MDLRPLGRSDLRVPPLCFGCNIFGWTVDEATSFRLLDEILDQGLTFLDTADVYSRWAAGHQGGESETIIGRWMKARGTRDRITLATKVGMDMGDGKVGLKPDYIRRAIEDSLRRLQTDRIDLYQAHKDDPDTPQAETLGAFADLIRAGKVRAIGASNFSAERLGEALDISASLGLPRYESLQPEYNLYERSGLRGRARARLPDQQHRGHQLLRARGRIPDRKVSVGGGLRQEPAGRTVDPEIHERAWPPHPGRPRRGLLRPRHGAGLDRARLADGEADHHGPDRERHHARTGEGPRGRDPG